MIKKKFLFLYLKTGGGHLAPARSISQFLNKHNIDKVDPLLVDGFEKSGKFVKFLIEDGYRILQNKAKWIYELIYGIHKIRLVAEISGLFISLFLRPYIEELILKENPDKIIIFHFFLIKPVYNVINKYNLNVKVFTAVTDPYIAHPLWFLKKDQRFIVFSEELKKYCVRIGIAEKNINVFPFILNEKYSNAATPEEIKTYKIKHSINKEKVLLILGGGDGIPHGLSLLKNIFKYKNDFDIIMVCGKNQELYKKAEKFKHENNFTNLKIYGYVDFVYELLSVSDIVISKCGASTLMEILILKKIPIINSYIWEQEKGNVMFVERNKLGVFEKNIKKLPVIIGEIFTNKNLLEYYKKNIENLHLENGTAKVAGFFLND